MEDRIINNIVRCVYRKKIAEARKILEDQTQEDKLELLKIVIRIALSSARAKDEIFVQWIKLAIENGLNVNHVVSTQIDESDDAPMIDDAPLLSKIIAKPNLDVELKKKLISDFINLGVDVNAFDCGGYTILAFVAMEETIDPKSKLELIEMLVRRGADPKGRISSSGDEIKTLEKLFVKFGGSSEDLDKAVQKGLASRDEASSDAVESEKHEGAAGDSAEESGGGGGEGGSEESKTGRGESDSIQKHSIDSDEDDKRVNKANKNIDANFVLFEEKKPQELILRYEYKTTHNLTEISREEKESQESREEVEKSLKESDAVILDCSVNRDVMKVDVQTEIPITILQPTNPSMFPNPREVDIMGDLLTLRLPDHW